MLKKKRKLQQSGKKRRSKDAAADDMHPVECGSLCRRVLVSRPQPTLPTQEAIQKKEQEQKQKEEAAITYTVIACEYDMVQYV